MSPKLKLMNQQNTITVEPAYCDHFGPGQSDDNNRMMTLIDEIYLLIFSKLDLEMWSH